MSTIANNVVAKLSVALVATAMMVALVAPAAQAATEEEMAAQIADLMATIAALQAQMGGAAAPATAGTSCPSIPAPLTMGAQNANVTALQNFLIGAGQSIPAGATGYFGGQTQSALAGWQAANGVSPAVGYYGPITKAAIDAKCVVVDNGGDEDEEGEGEMDDSLKGGEADVTNMQGRDEEDEAAEGEEDVAVHRVEFDVEDADIKLSRVDVTFDNSAIDADGEESPWDAFDEISIWVDGDKVASEDATDEDDWDEDGNEFTFRVSGVDAIFREDDAAEVVIAVSVQGGVDVDGDAGDDDWDVYVATDGMRFVDGLGIDLTDGPGAGDASTFEIIEEGENDDLELASSDEDPSAQTFEIDADDKVEHMIFAFELDAGSSDNDVTLDNLISVNVFGSDTLNDYVDDFRLEVDGESFDAESYTGTGTSAVVDFDIDGDVTIDADDTITVMLYAMFDDVGDAFDSETIAASTTPAQIDAEGADDLTVTGSSVVTSETHTVRTDGVSVEYTDDATSLDENDDTDPLDDEGEFTLEFDVTAFGDDLYIPFGAGTTTDLTTGFEFSILDNSNAVVGVGGTDSLVVSVDVADGNAEETNSYKVAEGTTESFTLIVKFDPATAGAYKVRLDTVNTVVSDLGTATDAQDVSDQDIDTAKLTI